MSSIIIFKFDFYVEAPSPWQPEAKLNLEKQLL